MFVKAFRRHRQKNGRRWRPLLISSVETTSENEFACLGKTRQRLDGGIEEDVFRNGAAFGDEDLGAGGIAVTLDRHQTAAIAQLTEKSCRNFLDRAVDEDQIIGSAGSVTLSSGPVTTSILP